MRWSGLKRRVEDNFAPSLKGRLTINSAAYGACTCGHAWLTLDSRVIANFCTRASGNLNYRGMPDRINKMYAGQLTGYGEISRQDAYRACWAFVHSLTIDAALKDEDPLVQTLAVADARLGRRRLNEIDAASLHPLAGKLLSERLKAESRRVPPLS